MLGLSIEDVAAAAGTSRGEIEELEADRHSASSASLYAIKGALEAKGILFLSSGNQDEGGPGIRLKAREHPDDGTRPENLNATNDD